VFQFLQDFSSSFRFFGGSLLYLGFGLLPRLFAVSLFVFYNSCRIDGLSPQPYYWCFASSSCFLIRLLAGVLFPNVSFLPNSPAFLSTPKGWKVGESRDSFFFLSAWLGAHADIIAKSVVVESDSMQLFGKDNVGSTALGYLLGQRYGETRRR
jgi:hypothetical protein